VWHHEDLAEIDLASHVTAATCRLERPQTPICNHRGK